MQVCHILFICMGNICRSPLAEGIAKAIYQGFRDIRLDSEPQTQAKQGIVQPLFDSAGISGFHRGEAPCKGSQEVALRHGINISELRSRPVRKADAQTFHYLVAMDSENIHSLLDMGFPKEKILRIGDFGDGLDVPDPYYYRNAQGFETIFEMLYPSIKNLLKQQEIIY